MASDPFYKAHWVDIDPARMARYRTGFQWSPASLPFYAPADIQPGHQVADFGCGPGHVAVEIARWVGPDGHVHAVDINPEFLTQAAANARDGGVADRLTTHLSDGGRLPLADASLDRVTVRNTLIYVDDPGATLREFLRVLRPGGRFHAVEGDWPMMVAEPVAAADWAAFAEAAGVACRTVDMGRKLHGLAVAAGFNAIEVQVLSRPDVSGRLLPMIRNMASYARQSGRLPAARIDEIVARLEAALGAGNYLVVAPQWVITADKQG